MIVHGTQCDPVIDRGTRRDLVSDRTTQYDLVSNDGINEYEISSSIDALGTVASHPVEIRSFLFPFGQNTCCAYPLQFHEVLLRDPVISPETCVYIFGKGVK